MPQGFQALCVLLILLPGFLSAAAARLLSAREKQSDFEKVVEALIFSFVTYAFYLIVFNRVVPVDIAVAADKNGVAHYSIAAVHRWQILFLLVVPLLEGFIWASVQNRDLLMTALRRFGLTERTSRESVWNDVFITLGGTVQVGLDDGRMIVGLVERYSDSDGERSLFLKNAAWVDQAEDTQLISIPGAGILITEVSKIKFVMFLDPGKED
jgi:hypothetical protein